MNENYTCKINKNQSFQIKLNENVFHPTGTSDEIIKSVSKNIDRPGTILDLGCGSGIVGFALYILGKSNGPIYASDLSPKAISLIEENAKNLSIPVISRHGNIFEPWEKLSFDYIVDDISGIAEDIAEISPWFKKTSCKSGKDGSDLVIKAITKSPNYLNNAGKFFFPILSLSNTEKIIDAANQTFKIVQKISHKEWRLPDEFKLHMDLLVDLKSKKLINFEEKYGWTLWSTDIYVAELPK